MSTEQVSSKSPATTKATAVVPRKLTGFMVPFAKSHFHPKTNFVHSTVCRFPSNKNRYVFYLEDPKTGERRATFVAQRQNLIKINIFDVSTSSIPKDDPTFEKTKFEEDGPRFVGQFTRARENSDYIGAHLFSGRGGDKKQVGSVLFRIPSSKEVLSKGFSTKARDTYFAINANTGAENHNLLEVTTKGVLRRTAKLQDLHAPGAGMVLLDTVPRYTKKGVKGTFWNFGNRSGLDSNKNHQMQDQTTKEKVIQICKSADHEFWVDFKNPLNAFQAFGFAMAQFEGCSFRL